jgi:molybdate transport system substrate-binding protein
MSNKRHLVLFPPLLLLLTAFAACGDDDAEDPSQTSSTSGAVTVFAASSLTDAFEEMADALGETRPGIELRFNFGGSQDLRTQLEQGAEADVFASANQKQMDAAVESGVAASDSVVFARNRLVIIVPADNPAGIGTLRDLAAPGTKIVLANPDVPVGQYCRDFLANAAADPAFGAGYGEDVGANVVSEETNVKQVVAKVQLGEVDAGCVYVTDVTDDVTSEVEMIDIPDGLNEIATYQLALTAEPANPAPAQAFVDFVMSDEGQTILQSYGFLPPES